MAGFWVVVADGMGEQTDKRAHVIKKNEQNAMVIYIYVVRAEKVSVII